MILSKKKVVIFGGTSGIGLATIKLLLKLRVAKVIAISRNPKKLKLKDKRLSLEKVDVLNESAVKTIFKKIGSYDVLVSTATGGDRAIGPFLSMKIEGFRNSFDKLWGYANVVKYGTKKTK